MREVEWFPAVLRVTGNFGFGLQEAKDALTRAL